MAKKLKLVQLKAPRLAKTVSARAARAFELGGPRGRLRNSRAGQRQLQNAIGEMRSDVNRMTRSVTGRRRANQWLDAVEQATTPSWAR